MQGLVLQDLKVAAGAIELASQRGAYRPNEFKVIGDVYEKLIAFIKSAEPAADTGASGGEQPETAVTETPQETPAA